MTDYPMLRPEDLRPMTPDEVAEMRAQRITEEEPEYCRVPGAADAGRCGYAGPDGADACGPRCRYEVAADDGKGAP